VLVIGGLGVVTATAGLTVVVDDPHRGSGTHWAVGRPT